MKSDKQLQQIAQKLRSQAIRMTTEAGSGHPTSCLSCAEIFAALFFEEMRWDQNDPQTRNTDTFILSKGHAAPILWAALYEAGAIYEDPLTLRRAASSLEGHPMPSNPWIKVATGSLGQGLSAANGIALANRLDGLDSRVYCLLGDGECSEGAVWEAAQFASLNGLANIVAIVDANGLGQSCPAPYDHDLSVLARRFEAFGWKTLEIDGHDVKSILAALAAARHEGPTVIIAKTTKGKGVSFLEGEEGWHGKALDRGGMEQALDEIGEGDVEAGLRPRQAGEIKAAARRSFHRISPQYKPGDAVATRDAFGNALQKLGKAMPELVVLDGDVKDSTRTQGFERAIPERFFQCYIAEQNMVGTALGLAVSGKLPCVATFACFLTRAYDFIRMAGYSQPRHLVFFGSHAGVSIGQDGPSQMGLEDIAMFRTVLGSTILYPCDAVSAERLTDQAVKTRGIVYLRATRSKTPVIYSNHEEFPLGGSKTLRSSASDDLTIVAAGVTVHEALAAYEKLKSEEVRARVIDAYSVKPLDVDTLSRSARETGRLLVVEDHWKDGGLGDAVAGAIGSLAPIYRLAVTKLPHSGDPEELLDLQGISRRAIEERVLSVMSPWERSFRV